MNQNTTDAPTGAERFIDCIF